MSIQSRRTNYYLERNTAVVGFQRLVIYSVYWMLEYVIKNMVLMVHLKLKAALNSTTTLSIWKPNTSIPFFGTFVEYCSTQLKHQTKAWLKWWSFQCVVSSVCMQLNTHHWNLFSRSLRPICRNVCLCVHVSVCVCMSLPYSWVKRDFDKITKKVKYLFLLSSSIDKSSENCIFSFFLSFKCLWIS